LSLAP